MRGKCALRARANSGPRGIKKAKGWGGPLNQEKKENADKGGVRPSVTEREFCRKNFVERGNHGTRLLLGLGKGKKLELPHFGARGRLKHGGKRGNKELEEEKKLLGSPSARFTSS